MSRPRPIAFLLAMLAVAAVLATSAALSARAATPGPSPPSGDSYAVEPDIRALSSLGDRSTGSAGADRAASYIEERFRALGLAVVDREPFLLPVIRHRQAVLSTPDRNIPLHALHLYAMSPGSASGPGVSGGLLYAGRGELADFDGMEVKGSIVLMDFDSGRNWLNAAMLGAGALIFVDRGGQGGVPKGVFDEKREETPVNFPRFWMSEAEARQALGRFEDLRGETSARLVCDVRWRRARADNVYGLVPGADKSLAGELVVVEAFYDSTADVADYSPGADESASVAQLLVLARYLAEHPPSRPVLLVATSGHAQTLAGMREFVWALTVSARDIRARERELKGRRDTAVDLLGVLREPDVLDRPELWERLGRALAPSVKDEVDAVSVELARLHGHAGRLDAAGRERVRELADRRLMLRRLGWRSDFGGLLPDERAELMALIPKAAMGFEEDKEDAVAQLGALAGTRRLREAVGDREIAACVSLHLSSRGNGVGAVGGGWLYPLREDAGRQPYHAAMSRVLASVAAGLGGGMYRDTLRPSSLSRWQDLFGDRPALGGEVSQLAGMPGFTLATLDDSRPYWGTPYDAPERVDWARLEDQSAFVLPFVAGLASAPVLKPAVLPGNGFSTLAGRAKFIRQGEVFADQPSPGTVVQAWQGRTIYHAMTDEAGSFELKGLADKRHVYEKVILEAYKFDPATGEAKWAIDKNRTNKDATRVRMNRRSMETDLVMFGCDQMTAFDLLDPRSFRHLNRVSVIDAAREAQPLRYSFSRPDSGASTLLSVFPAPGTPLKLAFSDTVLTWKMLLLNARPGTPEGSGYLPDEWPFVTRTEFEAARDMWDLVRPRVAALEEHGIVNERVRGLMASGLARLRQAEEDLAGRRYGAFMDAARFSLAQAARVYADVSSTQKDVLVGVLFYIAMFAPFALVMERLVFGFADIHRRILGFLGILGAVIALVYAVHPAFQLTYSPVVVILAFFILGLSVMVALIIFLRFEREMAALQRRARHRSTTEISRGKAFAAAFSLGVSNLRRRRLRTGLTVTTLVILTFTIMNFTTVKTFRRQEATLLSGEAPYRGALVKGRGWLGIDRAALDDLGNMLHDRGLVGPRVWLESEDRSRAVRVPLSSRGHMADCQGAVGLGPDEPAITGLSQILVAGRWPAAGEADAVLVSEGTARALAIEPQDVGGGVPASMWGTPVRIVGIFSPERLDAWRDLDGEPLTPVVFPSEAAARQTEAEVEAREAGEESADTTGRYQHLPAEGVLIAPAETLLAMGGSLKAMAMRPGVEGGLPGLVADLGDRLSLALFSGQADGTYLHYSSEALSYSGMPNIAVPLLISALIVLNTMIGSVYERKREIAVYTSVGLAPSHVAFLFIAEALAFAVLSTVLGYLLAQASAWLLAGSSLWSGMTANYSSLAGVAAMALVILVVLVSVVYPSRVAAGIAIPDVNRSWTMPAPEGDEMHTVLPFLIKLREQACVGGYLCEYYGEHRDVSHGLFSTGWIETGVACPVGRGEAGECLYFCAMVWLAPFDFGIKQRVRLSFCPSAEDPGFLEIAVDIVREAGEVGAWRRMNKAFLNDLRKQLLVWRSLEPSAQAAYADKLVRRRQGGRG